MVPGCFNEKKNATRAPGGARNAAILADRPGSPRIPPRIPPKIALRQHGAAPLSQTGTSAAPMA
jgi:hypothetical protein